MGCKSRPVVMVHKRDGHVVRRFASVAEAAQCTRQNRDAVTKNMRGGMISPGPYLLRYEDEWAGREDFSPRSTNLPVIVAGGRRISWFDSITSAAQALGVPYDRIRSPLCRGYRSRLGFRVRYAESTDDWPLLRADIAALARRGIEPENPLALGKPAHDAVRGECDPRKEGEVPAA